MVKRFTLAQRHLINVSFTSVGSLNHIFTDLMRLSSRWRTSELTSRVGLNLSSHPSRSTILTLHGLPSGSIEVVKRFFNINSHIHLNAFKFPLSTTGFSVLLWYPILRWTEETRTSSFAKKDIPRIPLKTLLHETTRKRKITFLSHSPSHNDSGRSATLQGRVTKSLKAKRPTTL